MAEEAEKQVLMHKDFFDRCKHAIENKFYLEAILMEYAAIESRLEATCGVLGLPCGRECAFRKDIKISTRIECLRVYRQNNPDVFKRTKLPQNFFTKKGTLNEWIDKRNRIVHGLFKDELKYTCRVQDSSDLAKKGYEYARLLYNEVKRIRRLKTNHPDYLETTFAQCKNEKCRGYRND